MPRPAQPTEASRGWMELEQQATHLIQRSRFLCRQSDRLLGRSNDLLTVGIFRRERRAARSSAGRPTLTLVS